LADYICVFFLLITFNCLPNGWYQSVNKGFNYGSKTYSPSTIPISFTETKKTTKRTYLVQGGKRQFSLE